MAPPPTRKRLLFLIRKNHPKVPLKYSKSFQLNVQGCLVKLLGFQMPLTSEDSYFLSNEVNNFAKTVPEYFKKCNRSQVVMLKKHQVFFDKVYQNVKSSVMCQNLGPSSTKTEQILPKRIKRLFLVLQRCFFKRKAKEMLL